MNRKQRRAAARAAGKDNNATPNAVARTDERFGWFAENAPKLLPYEPAPNAQCPDCGARFDHDTKRMTHEDGCPIYAGDQAASDDDRQWFRAHPGVTVRRRPATMGEVQQQMLMAGITLPDLNTDVTYEPDGEVVVHFVADGARLRNFRGVALLAKVGVGGP